MMETPKTRKSPAREKILKTAEKLFYENGYHATGIDRVLAESGAAKMSLYKHFKSKDGLICEVIKDLNDGFMPMLKAAVEERSKSPKKKPLVLFEVLEDLLVSDLHRGCPLMNASIEFSDASHEVRELVMRQKQLMAEYFEELLRPIVKKPQQLAQSMAVLYHGALAWFLITGKPEAASSAKTAMRALINANLK